MPELEDLLLGSDEEETEAAPTQDSNKTIREMRKALKERESALKERDAKLAELEPKLQQYVDLAEKAQLKELGLTEKQANAFRKTYGEINDDNLREFKVDVLGMEVEAPSTDESEAAPSQPFRPTPTSANAGVKLEYTTADWNELRAIDPVKADKVLREGRVKRQTFNPGGPAF